MDTPNLVSGFGRLFLPFEKNRRNYVGSFDSID